MRIVAGVLLRSSFALDSPDEVKDRSADCLTSQTGVLVHSADRPDHAADMVAVMAVEVEAEAASTSVLDLPAHLLQLETVRQAAVAAVAVSEREVACGTGAALALEASVAVVAVASDCTSPAHSAFEKTSGIAVTASHFDWA